MIIYDLDGYKLDAQWSRTTNPKDPLSEWWLEVTSFRKKGDTEWVTKTTKYGPEAQQALVKLLASGPPREFDV